MATAIKKCRVCGKTYTACRTMRNNTNVFRWQEVACSPECGSLYLAQIEASRRTSPVEINKAELRKTNNYIVLLDDDDIDTDEAERELREYFDDTE